MFSIGATGLIAEYLLSLVGTYILGNSVEQFSITIALMLLCMGVASLVQNVIPKQYLTGAFLTSEIVLCLLMAFGPVLLYAGYGVLDSHFELLQYSLICGIGLLVGLEIPLVLRLNQERIDNLGQNMSAILMADYAGAFIGAMVWLKILLPNVQLMQIGFYISLVNLTFVGIFWISTQRTVKLFWTGVIAILLCYNVVIYGLSHSKHWEPSMEQRFYNDKIVLSHTTVYQHLVLTHDAFNNDYQLFINGNKQFSSIDEHIYHESLVHPAMAHCQKNDSIRVLVLGGGDGMACREVLKYGNKIQKLRLVDLDPGMTDLFSTHPVLLQLNDSALVKVDRTRLLISPETVISHSKNYAESGNDTVTYQMPQVEVVSYDADLYLDTCKGGWDVVILDFPDPSSPELCKLYSLEFYTKLKTKMSRNGVMACQSTSPYHAKPAYLSILKTISHSGFSTVPYHCNVPSFGDWGFVLAAKSDSIKRPEWDGIPWSDLKWMDRGSFNAMKHFGKSELTDSTLNIESNSNTNPVLLDYYNMRSWHVY